MQVRSTAGTKAPWVLVAGGFHQEGGMDRLNAALARYLVAEGAPVYLVGYRIDEELTSAAGVSSYLINKTAGSFFLGQARLDRKGRAVAAKVTAAEPAARVVVNGVNCAWPDLDWVHFVNHAWPSRADHGPLWLRVKSRLEARLTLRRERWLLPLARVLIANSNRTARDLVQFVGVPEDRVVTVYPGVDESWVPATPAERIAARAWLSIDHERPVVAFVGALGHDPRKGFDTLWAAWQRLCERHEWTATLIVAGGGRAVDDWRRIIARRGLEARVKMLGFTSRIPELLAAADLLISPARYEPYGLNVHEAICRGVPAMVTAATGVAERYPAALADMLIPDAEDAADLAARLLAWSTNIAVVRERFAPFRRFLASWTTDAMASQIVAVAARTRNKSA
ncbi:MAG TPA: glycosyltransferase family 4 protein [Candidatus Binataceae bacterium]|nr:glycosyltransferase family 4 protein [Candidatus Binataceae bacterium]